MSRLLTTLVALAVLAIGTYLVLFTPRTSVFTSTVAVGKAPRPSARGDVFELKYRGLDTPDDPRGSRSFWAFGWSQDARDPFTRAVKEQVKDCLSVHNAFRPQAPWAAVELRDKKPVAFCFDINADGRLSEKEKFPPAAAAGPGFRYPYAFITSDFTLETQDKRKVPFRVMLAGDVYGDNIIYLTSPFCVVEGQGTLAGEPMRLVLYPNGFESSFCQFGSCSFSLLPAGQPLPGSPPRETLSSLIRHQGVFYRLKLSDRLAQDQTVRATFEKDTTPTGHVAFELKGPETLKVKMGQATINGASDKSIAFSLPDMTVALPEGRYRIGAATLGYGTQNDTEWQVTRNEGPAFEISAGSTRRTELGQPALAVTAVDEKERYRPDVKERTTYTRGAAIYLAPQIKGPAGEVYMRFSRKNAANSSYTDVKPHFTIIDSAGRQVASGDLAYG